MNQMIGSQIWYYSTYPLINCSFYLLFAVLCLVDLLYRVYRSHLQESRQESWECNANVLCSSCGHYIMYVSAVAGLRVL
jgi:hypothetical protein